MLEHAVDEGKAFRETKRVVVSVDPAVSIGNDETGVVLVGAVRGTRDYRVMKDLSRPGPINRHAMMIVRLIDDGVADLVVAEKNNGGDLVEETLRMAYTQLTNGTGALPYKAVWAKRGKRLRAEPITALYEQNRVHHDGIFPELETEMVTWTEEMDSPNRLDALVYGLTELAQRDRAGRLRQL